VTGEEEAGLRARGARKGFPDDMLEAINNALFYVHGRAGKQRSGAAAPSLLLMVVGQLDHQPPTWATRQL